MARRIPHALGAFGLGLHSEIPLPDLPAGGGGPVVAIRLGLVPSRLEGHEAQGGLFQARPGALLLQVPGVGRFLVEEGDRITVDPAEGGAREDLAGWLLGPVIAALLQQRGALVLHGSAVQVGDSACLVLGPPGAGKSTLALGLAGQGRGVLSCDLCALDPEGRVASSVPFVRVWDDALRDLGLQPDSLPLARTDRPKRRVPLGASFVSRALPAGRILLLEITPSAEPRLEPVEAPRERLHLLLANSYRRGYLRGMGLLPRHLQQCRDLSMRLPFHRLLRPQGQPPGSFAAWVTAALEPNP